MKALLIQMKQTAELEDNEVNSLIALKQQYWAYDAVEQKRWLKENIRPDDLHLLGSSEGALLAYLNAVNVDVSVDRSAYRMLGIGNVCVDRKHARTGLGGILMACINAHIKQTQRCGILLCKAPLVAYYRRFGWRTMMADRSFVNGQPYKHFIMTLDPEKRMPKDPNALIEISRNF